MKKGRDIFFIKYEAFTLALEALRVVHKIVRPLRGDSGHYFS